MEYTRLLTFLMLLLTQHKTQGSSETIQEFQKIRMKISISFPEDKVPKDFIAVLWLYNLTQTVGKYSDGKSNVTQLFIESVEITGPTTLTFLKLISGCFFAKVIGNQTEIVLDFNITFQESPGELKVHISSNFFFNITITCSMEDVEINSTFICENNTCRQEGGERSKVTKSGDFLRLYQSNSTIICSRNNQVSETQNKTTIQPNPTSKGPAEQNVSLPRGHVALYVSLGVFLLTLFGVAWCILKKFNNRRERSRSETFPNVPPQTSQHLLGNKVFPSRDEEIELKEVSWSQSGTSALSGKSMQENIEEEP